MTLVQQFCVIVHNRRATGIVVVAADPFRTSENSTQRNICICGLHFRKKWGETNGMRTQRLARPMAEERSFYVCLTDMLVDQ